MLGRPLVVCDSPELSTELAGLATELDLELEIVIEEGPVDVHERAELICVTTPLDPLVLLELGRRATPPVLVSLAGDARSELLALEVGLAVCDELGAGLAALRLEREGVDNPASLGLRSLTPLARKRLGLAGGRSSARLVAAEGGRVALLRGDDEPRLLGRLPEVARAARSIMTRRPLSRAPMPMVDGVDRRLVLDIILGPPRVLSDPASKSVLFAYGLTLPVEELCASPSRAASEATRIGFPVRLALTSPDLRASEHADLHVDGVDSASRVREIYRQMMTLAAGRAEGARVLGVTVSASTTARALLSLGVSRLGDEHVAVDFAFADPHGAAAGDRGLAILPTDPEGLERALSRLAGRSLLFGETPGERRHLLASFAEVSFRLAAIVRDFPSEILAIELPRLAVLPGGDLEIREAKIEIGDAFSRQIGEVS